MAHPFLDAADVGLGDHSRPEGVAKVVEAELALAGALQRRVVAAPQTGAIEVGTRDPDEDEIIVAGEELAIAEVGQRRGDIRRHRHRADLA